MKNNYIKSPLNYIGGKWKILNQIIPLFPSNINTFVDLFAGGCNVGINVSSQKVIFNDNISYLIDMYRAFLNNSIDLILNYIYEKINYYKLSKVNVEGYNALRADYNTNKHPLDLFILIAFSFNHQIRFNNKHHFNNPFGHDRSSFNSNMKYNLIKFIQKLKEKNSIFTNLYFSDYDFSSLSANDFIYCDPPYLITTATYNDGKRGFNGWNENEEIKLLSILDKLNNNNIYFALSNVIEHKGKKNNILLDWLEDNPNFIIHRIDNDFSNSNYHTLDKEKNTSTEVLITNYKISQKYKQTILF